MKNKNDIVEITKDLARTYKLELGDLIVKSNTALVMQGYIENCFIVSYKVSEETLNAIQKATRGNIEIFNDSLTILDGIYSFTFNQKKVETTAIDGIFCQSFTNSDLEFTKHGILIKL